MMVPYLQSCLALYMCYAAFFGVEMVLALCCISGVLVDSVVVVHISTFSQWLRVVLAVIEYV